jgi:hypothetical protein
MPRGCGLALVVLLLGAAQEAPIDFDRAEREIVRVPPLYFLGMPPAIREALESRGCTVPQTWGEQWPNNAVRGHFTGDSSDDWAVLCSRRSASSLLVFRGGKVVASLVASPDRHYLAGVVPGRAVYQREIRRIEPREIRSYCRTFGEKCPPISHDGIEEFPKSNVSQVHYFDGRKWLKLPGAD